MAGNGKIEKIKGRIERQFFRANNYSVGTMRTTQGKSITVTASVELVEGELVELTGEWTNHPKYGKQFKAATLVHGEITTADDLEAYLAGNPNFKGIGPAKAKKIAQKYGGNFDDVIRNRPEEVAKAGSIPLPVAMQVQKIWIANHETNKVSMKLAGFGLTDHQRQKLVDKYGANAVDKVSEDPYLIIGAIHGFGFKRVDDIALRMGFDKHFPGRIRAGIKAALDNAVSRGHTWLDLPTLEAQAAQLLYLDRAEVHAMVVTMAKDGDLEWDKAEGKNILSLPEFRRMEKAVIDYLKKGNGAHPAVDKTATVTADLASGKLCPMLNEKQRGAALAALSYQCAVISGGAGSGKTFTISGIVNLLDELGLSVALAAPTGKAAKRMEQVVGKEAFTLHRLLGYGGDGWPDMTLNYDVVIVDETSMVDVHLAWRLLKAMDFDRTAVVFVGDHNQLPPVGPGNVLRDIIKTKIIPGVILTDVVRQAGVLKENSVAILRGEVAPTTASGDTTPWSVIDDCGAETEGVYAWIMDYFEGHLNQGKAHAEQFLESVQLLSPKRKGPLGVEDLNVKLQDMVQRIVYGVNVAAVKARQKWRKFFKHDRVIQRRNNYTLGVMNGATGKVLDLTNNGDMLVQFDGEPEPLWLRKENGDILDVQLAYALTVHQTQGSEFPYAVIVIHRSHSFMHSRNLFYTGVTRAKTAAIIVGDEDGIERCAQKVSADGRNTFMSLEKIKEGTDGKARIPQVEAVAENG